MNFNIFGKEIFVKKSILVVSALIIAFILGGIGLYIKLRDKPIIFDSSNEDIVTKDSIQTPYVKKTTTPVPTPVPEEIKVYLTGCVKKPGIVTLKKGQVIYDAVSAAGGLTDDADKNFNMVYVINENVWIDIKSKKAAAQSGIKASPSVRTTSTSKVNKEDQVSNKKDSAGEGVTIVKDSGGVITSEKQGGTGSKVNINTASAEEMDAALPGVGPKIASDIVAYRNKNGKFKAITDLTQVSGIGESKFNKIKDFITVN